LQANLTLMGSPSGVDLQPYVNDIIPGLRDKLLASLAPLSFSQPGTLSLEFVVLTDGSVDGVKVVSSSGDAPLDQSLGNALAAASPLQTLPPGLVDQSIQLRLNLSYSREVSDF
jgi:TonB family protein